MVKAVIVGDIAFGESGPPTRPPEIQPPRPPQRPGGRPVDPDWGIEEGGGGETGGQLPVWPIGPGQGLPPIPGQPLPPLDPPPGTIWPPLPPTVPPGKALVYAGIAGVGYRYIIVDVKPPKPGQGLPPHPDQGGPTPPVAEPKHD
jgi:hypothetical protein